MKHINRDITNIMQIIRVVFAEASAVLYHIFPRSRQGKKENYNEHSFHRGKKGGKNRLKTKKTLTKLRIKKQSSHYVLRSLCWGDIWTRGGWLQDFRFPCLGSHFFLFLQLQSFFSPQLCSTITRNLGKKWIMLFRSLNIKNLMRVDSKTKSISTTHNHQKPWVRCIVSFSSNVKLLSLNR